MALGLGMAITGCQIVPGDGPMMNGAKSTSTEALPFDVVDLTPATVVAYRAPASLDQHSIAGDLPAGGRLVAAPGDVLSVKIFEPYEGSIFPTVRNASAASLGNQTVTADGTIEVPYVGTVHVAGLTTDQIEQRIIDQLGTKAQDPQVIVDFAADRSNSVMISGDVRKPGRISLLEGARSVVDVVNAAGGLPAAQSAQSGDQAPPSGPTQYLVVVRRSGNVILTKQMSELLAGADIPVEKGDQIVVRPNSQSFTVLGAVMHAGNVPLTKPNMSLLEALGSVNGLTDERANKTGVYLFRMGKVQSDPTARARVFRLDLMQPVSIFVAQQFTMRPHDVIYVTNAPLYEYNKILTSIYRTLSIVGTARQSFNTSITVF
jgi:polysaccharide export outer membrane protein